MFPSCESEGMDYSTSRYIGSSRSVGWLAKGLAISNVGAIQKSYLKTWPVQGRLSNGHIIYMPVPGIMRTWSAPGYTYSFEGAREV